MTQDQTNAADDRIVRATARNHTIRAFACQTTRLCQEAVVRHDLSPVAAAALGRLMSGALLLAEDLDRPDDSLTVLIRADGPLGGLTVVADGQARVRGLVQAPVVASRYLGQGKLDVGAAVGRGTLTVIRDLGLKEPYVGQVELVSGEIAEDLAAYLAYSEQIPSVISLGVRLSADGVIQAGGFMVQLMPDAQEQTVAWLEEQVAKLPESTRMLEAGLGPEDMLQQLLGDDVQILAARPCAYHCPCQRERMAANLLALGRVELAELANDPDGIELTCHFCGRHYRFSQADIKGLLEASKQVKKDEQDTPQEAGLSQPPGPSPRPVAAVGDQPDRLHASEPDLPAADKQPDGPDRD